jgi:primary-amine oxidase
MTVRRGQIAIGGVAAGSHIITVMRAAFCLLASQQSGFALSVLIGLSLGAAGHAAPLHPLEPLNAEELARVGNALAHTGQFSKNTNFAWIGLEEPAKKVVNEFKPGSDFPRMARVVATDFDKRTSFEAIVDARAGKIAALTELGELQPGLSDGDIERARAIIDADPAVRAALLRRGLRIPGNISEAVGVQFAPFGHDRTLDTARRRLVRALFSSDQDAVNEFSPYLEGIMAVIDVFSGQVAKLYDAAGAPSVKVAHDIFNPAVQGQRSRANEVMPAKRNRRNFTIDRYRIDWQKWQFRFGFNAREGLVLHQISFNDNGKRRSIVYRAAVSDVLTAYGDPGDFWSWMEIFDEGVFGLGYLSMPVRPGREVPANAVTLSPVMADSSKKRFSNVFKDRIYVYERDAGNLLHYQQGDLVFHARATELVIGFLTSVGNYVYGFNWVFRQDGSFAFEADLAGEILTKFVAAKTCADCKAVAEAAATGNQLRTHSPTGDEQYGTLVAPNLVGTHHQHWFNLRLDFDLDGTDNAVMENNVQRASDDERPHAGTMNTRSLTVAHKVFGRAVDAKRDANEETSRTWTIYNPSSLRAGGRAAGYTVVPSDSTATLFPAARESEAVGFTFHHFWVTPYREAQRFASGAYPNQATEHYADTLYHYANGDSIYNTDIVAWYSLGETHVPRVEDYPVMPNAKLSVRFRPEGFFDRNPALGLGKIYGK